MNDNKKDRPEYLASDLKRDGSESVPDLPVETLLEVLGVLPMGVALYTPDQRMWAWNRIAEETSNLPSEITRIGVPLEDIIRVHAERGDYGEGDVDDLVAERLKAVYDNSIPKRELELPDGRYAEYGSHRLSDNTLVAFVRDITEQRRQEKEILERQRELEDLNRQKDELFALIAHDLRSPLSAVVGFARLLEMETEQEFDLDQAREWASLVGSGAKGLAELVDNLLNWARLQMDDYQFSPSAHNVSSLLEQAVSPLTAVATTKNISLETESPDIEVNADIDMIVTVLRNLANNAIKFVEPGGHVRSGCEVLANNKVRLFVEDNGVGMTQEIVAGLLSGDPVKSSRGTSHETGTGLGLRICHSFLARHNSRLEISSTVGKGSKVGFQLNLK